MQVLSYGFWLHFLAGVGAVALLKMGWRALTLARASVEAWRWLHRPLPPRPPCAHRYVRLRWRVEAGGGKVPVPECVDCELPLPNVRVKIEEEP